MNEHTSNKIASGFGIGAILLLLIALLSSLMDTHQAEEYVRGLDPKTQTNIEQYISEQSKLQVGDLVEVRDWDNLESTRWLAVSTISHGVAWAENYRKWEHDHRQGWNPEPEVIRLDPGIRAAIMMTEKHAFHFIRQDNPGWQANANWYWIQ